MSTCAHASISVCCSSFANRWKPQAQCWGGLSMEPHPLLILASHPVLSGFSDHPPSFSTFVLTKLKEQPLPRTGRPKNLAAGSGSLRFLKDKCLYNPPLTQAECGSKLWNIHMKITRLAAVKQRTYRYAGILHERTDVFVSSAAIVVLYLEYYIQKTNALLQEAGGHIRNHDESTINPQVLINLLPVESRAKIDELRAPQLILNHYRMLWFSPCVAFWSAFCQICWRQC